MSQSHIDIPGKFGFGTMSLTWTPDSKTVDEALEIINYTLEKYNVRFLNGGEFYGPDLINLKYLGKFWEKYGEKYPDLIISVKGAIDPKTLLPDGSRESIKNSISNFISFFPQEKAKRPILIYQIARVDPKVPYEETVGFINDYVKQGVIDGISLSEVGTSSINKALSVAPITSVEVELSLMCQDILTNGVLDEAERNDLTIIAYSPLCRGFLTERTANDFDAFYKLCHRPGDFRGHFGKFSEENFPVNSKVVSKLQEFAHQKGTTLESLALSWILALSELEGFAGIKKFPKIIPIPSGSTPDKVDLNLSSIITLSLEDLKAIKEITDSHEVKGYRYTAESQHLNFA